MTKIGQQGELIITEWLTKNDHEIIAQNWRCRQGEIDIIALQKQTNILVFVEVKTRRLNNWDQNGLLAVNEKKQEKILLTAQTFLSANPQYADHNCRFDLALVTYKTQTLKNNQGINYLQIKSNLDHSFIYQNYRFTIEKYLENILD